MRCFHHERVLQGPKVAGARRGGQGHPAGGDRASFGRLCGDHRPLREAQARDRRGGAQALTTGQDAQHICKTAEERRELWRQLEDNREATLERHCELWERERGVRVSVATISRAVRGLGWTYEQRRWEPPNETRKSEALGANA